MELLRFLSSVSTNIQIILFALPALVVKPKFQYSLLILSSFSAKLLHLYTHRASLPIVLYLLYLPTFLLPDVILLVCSKLLLFRQDKLSAFAPTRLLAALFAFTTAIASTCQTSFYLETGGEIQWTAGASLAADPAGLHLLLSGFPTFVVTFMVTCGVSSLGAPVVYDLVESALLTIYSAFHQVLFWVSNFTKKSKKTLQYESERGLFCPSVEYVQPLPTRRALAIVVAVVTTIVGCGILRVVRPTTPPYAHMSGSLPFVMLEAFLFSPNNAEFCLSRPQESVSFPFDDVFSNAMQQPAQGYHPGWMPRSDRCREGRHGHHHESQPQFATHRDGNDHSPSYDPSCDPLRLDNLDTDILHPIAQALDDTRIPIKHVLIMTLESTRKDVFPLKKGSRSYEKILSTYGNPDNTRDLDDRLSRLNSNSRILTGESDGFSSQLNEPHNERSYSHWATRFNSSFGGLNVQGVQTSSDYTFKSLLGSHCGVEALPVDFTEEVKGQIYQPCVPHILDMFNEDLSNDGNQNKKEPGFLSSPWQSVLVQSITDQYDSQNILDDHMGFRNVVTKETILDPSSKYYPPKEPECNYFGFPETETFPYLRDLFTEAERNDQRLFLSHVTSTTHHPFHPPKSWRGSESYLATSRWRAEVPFNNYLNTIKYQDEWIGTIFDLLNDVGVINQTLVVLVGDHGMAFDSIDGSSQTYQNSHISNFNVPMLFLHPHLPRIQLNAKTTSLSIVPTMIDLLIQTKSLNSRNIETAQHLIHRYQGQSLIREFLPSKEGGRQLWYFGLINPGGSMIVISSATTSYRLLLPLCSSVQFKFTDIGDDPAEQRPITEWSIEKLVARLQDGIGEEAATWVQQAEKLGKWWFWEQRRRWNYHKAARSIDRSGEESAGGQIKKKHWWNT